MIPHTTHHHGQQALKMSGVFIKLTPENFQNLLNRNEGLAVVTTTSTFFSTSYTYVTSYKGLIFYCKAKHSLSVPGKHETIHAETVALPVM